MVTLIVRAIYVALLLFVASPLLQADFANSDIFVTSNIDEYQAFENQPLEGTITVTHDQSNKVDLSSFFLGGKPIKVEFIRDVKISSTSPIVISYYHFQIPAQSAGLYMLPEATVTIAGKQYRSIMSSYEVKAANGNYSPKIPYATPSDPMPQASSSSNPVSSQVSSGKIIFKVEADAGSRIPLYPGQKTKFTYRYIYNGDVGLTREELPLLDAEGFLKYGDKEIKQYTENNMTVSEVSQTVKAIKPGTFHFPASVVEGYAYTKNAQGQPVYSSEKLSSQIPEISVTVLPFPEAGKPPSFNGAIGEEFSFATSIASSADVLVGDELRLNLDISGKGDIAGVNLPDVARQPGFNGFFRMSDLPPVGSVTGDTKHAVVVMRPVVAAIKEIPSIEFSFFNPKTKEYVILRSKPIPVTVKPADEGIKQIAKPAQPSLVEPAKTYAVQPIEIQGNFELQATDLYDKIFGTWWALGVVPFGVALIIYQINIRNYLNSIKQKMKQATSGELYQEFLRQPKGSSRYYDLLSQSLKSRLAESGLIPSANIPKENLLEKGLTGEVRAFLDGVEEQRFSQTGEFIPAILEEKAHALMERLAAEIHVSEGEK